MADVFDGESGNDIVMPAALRGSPLGNIDKGGSGHDLIILVNGMMDAYVPGSAMSIPIDNRCKVSGAWDDNPDDGKDEPTKFTVGCGVPIVLPKSAISRGIKAKFDFAAGVDSNGNFSWESGIGTQFAGLKLNELGQLRVETALKADVCVCDPKLGPLWPGDMKF